MVDDTAADTRRESGSAEDWAALRPASEDDPTVSPWAWARRERSVEEAPDLSGLTVVGVLVALDAEDWLADTLAGLAALDRRPDRLIAIDVASLDRTGALLQRALQQGSLDAVYHAEHRLGFGAAVASALDQDRGVAGTDLDRPDTWLWLLHDDAVPSPDALTQLASHVQDRPEIDVTGPKLLLPDRRTGAYSSAPMISEVGVSISGTGRREILVEPGEIDQGQRDEPAERLGVSTCAMLVRGQVWTALGGLDPALPVFRDGVEFGWRAHNAGHRVVTTPRARVTHRQVGRAGLRPAGAAGRHPGKTDRELGMLVVVGHARTAQLPLVWLRLIWGSLLHALGYLLGKVPRRSLDEVAALGAFLTHPRRIHSFRRRVATRPPVDGAAEVVRALRPAWWSSLRVAVEGVSGAIGDRYRSVAGDLDAASLDELTGDDFAGVGEERGRNPWLSPIVLTVAVSVFATLVAIRDLMRLGVLTSPALLPAGDLAALWASAWEPIAGAAWQSSPPWLALSAVGATITLGRPDWFVTLLICLAVPLSIVSVYPVFRRVAVGRGVRLVGAVGYALLPVLLGGTNQGRLVLSVIALGLPLLVLAARAVVLRRVRAPEAWRGGWGAGVALTMLVAFEPALFLLAVAVGLGAAVALRRTPRKIGRVGIALLVPIVVWAPWIPSLIEAPGRLLVGPDSVASPIQAAPQAWALLIGRETGGGLPPLWLGAAMFAGLWVVALAGLARSPRRWAVGTGWSVAVLAFGFALVLSRLVVVVPPAATEARPWVGSFLLVGFAALIVVGAAGLDGVLGQVRRQAFSWLQPATALAAAFVAALALAGGGWWVWAGAAGPIERTTLNAIPPYVRLAMVQDGVRTLAIDLSTGEARYSVVADDQIRLGDADLGFTYGGASSTKAEVRELVVRLVAGTADDDIAPQLRELTIGYLWVRDAGAETVARIDNTPGLGPASGNESATIWRVENSESRLRLRGPEGSSATVGYGSVDLPPGAEGRVLLLGEPADRRWRASVDGVPLAATEGGWQQAFVVPASGGRLDYSISSLRSWLLPLQGMLLVVAAILAAPAIRRPEVRDPTKVARRAARVTGGRR